jgi:hypothetical protein
MLLVADGQGLLDICKGLDSSRTWFRRLGIESKSKAKEKEKERFAVGSEVTLC